MNVQSITLDLSKRQIPTQIVRIGQGDNEGTTIQAKILDNGTVASLSGFSASFEMRLPDDESYVRDINCTVSGNTVTYVVDEEHCCAVDGYTDEAYFNLTKDGSTYSTSRFRVKVERSAHDGAIPAEDWDNAVDELINRGNAQLDEYEEAEELRESNEETRVSNESTRVSNETSRTSNETNRTTAETARVAAENARAAAEQGRATAETARVTAEQGRVTADEARTQQQTANNTSQTANNTAQSHNDSAQLSNDTEQAQNNLDQQRNNEAAASGYARYLVAGEYNPTTGKPTISAETEMRMVITPNPDQDDPDNRMLEWARRYDSTTSTWGWELVGGTGWKPTPATTVQANSMWDDLETVTSSNNPDVSWMSYYATKIREWVTDHFVGINTIARVAQVISSGEVQATVSNVVHKLSEKLNIADYRKALKWGEVSDEWLWGETGQTPSTQGTTYTGNLGLVKPGLESTVSVDDFNDNADVIDALAGDIATVEESPSTAAHSVGEFLIYEGRVYKVTAAISIGDSLTLGSNIAAANVGSELASLKSSLGKTTLTNVVLPGFRISYIGFLVLIPAMRRPNSVTVSSAGAYVSSSSQTASITFVNWVYEANYVILRFNTDGLTGGSVYGVLLSATIS